MAIGELILKGSQNTLTALQLTYDYYKHITTLSLGVVLFISAFLKTSNAGGLREVFILFSITAFLISIIFSLMIMRYISKILSYSSSAQGFSQLIDASSLLEPQKQLEELKKIGVQMNAFMDKSMGEAKLLQKWIIPTWSAFLCGVIFAVLYIVSPIFYRLWNSLIYLFV
jgi:hypothetical protein